MGSMEYAPVMKSDVTLLRIFLDVSQTRTSKEWINEPTGDRPKSHHQLFCLSASHFQHAFVTEWLFAVTRYLLRSHLVTLCSFARIALRRCSVSKGNQLFTKRLSRAHSTHDDCQRSVHWQKNHPMPPHSSASRFCSRLWNTRQAEWQIFGRHDDHVCILHV